MFLNSLLFILIAAILIIAICEFSIILIFLIRKQNQQQISILQQQLTAITHNNNIQKNQLASVSDKIDSQQMQLISVEQKLDGRPILSISRDPTFNGDNLTTMEIKSCIGQPICTFDFSDSRRNEPTRLSKEGKASVQALIKGMANSSQMIADGILSHNNFVVKFSKEVMTGMANGTIPSLENGTKAIARCGGKFKEIPTIIRGVTPIAIVNVAFIVWQVLAMATAQHYLSEINEKLESIYRELKEIKLKINNHRLGKLQGNLLYLQRCQQLMEKGNLSFNELKNYLSQTESIFRESLQIINSCKLDISSYLLNNMTSSSDNTDLSKNEKLISESLEEYNFLQQTIYFAFYINAFCIFLQKTLGSSSADTTAKIMQESWKDIKIEFKKNKEKISNGIEKLKAGAFTFESTATKCKDRLFNSLKKNEKLIEDYESTISDRLKESINDEKDHPIDIVIAVDNEGNVVNDIIK